jgi:ATP-dependent protease ClpP protease subunit
VGKPDLCGISGRRPFRQAEGEVTSIYSQLLRECIVFIAGTVDDAVSSLVVAQLLFLEVDNQKKEINMYLTRLAA